MVDSENRRNFERITISKQIEMTTPKGTQKGKIRDISLGGQTIDSAEYNFSVTQTFLHLLFIHTSVDSHAT